MSSPGPIRTNEAAIYAVLTTATHAADFVRILQIPRWDNDQWNDIERTGKQLRGYVAEIIERDLAGIDLDTVNWTWLIRPTLAEKNVAAGRPAGAGLPDH